MKISIVSPIYRAENIVDELVRQIIKNVEPLTSDFEIVLVNDASPDHSWMKIRENCSRDSRVKGINLSRNFGQHYAITAGLSYTSGEWVVVMDCDLQDRPDEIPNLYESFRRLGYCLCSKSGAAGWFLEENEFPGFSSSLFIFEW